MGVVLNDRQRPCSTGSPTAASPVSTRARTQGLRSSAEGPRPGQDPRTRPTWQAGLTDRGRTFLSGYPTPDPARTSSETGPAPDTDRESQPSPARVLDRPPTKTERLVVDAIATGGRLVLPDETAKGGVNWRQRAYAAQRHGKVPDGKRLVVSRGRDGFVIELKDGLAGNELGADQINVPARLTKYHRVARQFRDRQVEEIAATPRKGGETGSSSRGAYAPGGPGESKDPMCRASDESESRAKDDLEVVYNVRTVSSWPAWVRDDSRTSGQGHRPLPRRLAIARRPKEGQEKPTQKR
jgi:hypothetical protein